MKADTERNFKASFLPPPLRSAVWGGLGSNISIALARAGIGRLLLVDFDKVDITNLHRQQYKANQIGKYKTEALSENLKEIAPYINIETVTDKIREDNIA